MINRQTNESLLFRFALVWQLQDVNFFIWGDRPVLVQQLS